MRFTRRYRLLSLWTRVVFTPLPKSMTIQKRFAAAVLALAGRERAQPARREQLELGAVHDAVATARARAALRAWLAAQGLAAVRVSTRRVETWHSGRSGKRRRVVAAEAR